MPKNAPGGQPDMNELLKQAQKMQEQLLAAQAEAEPRRSRARPAAAWSRSRSPAAWSSSGVTIDPAAVDPDDVEMLEDLVLAAIHDAVTKAGEISEQAMGGLDLGGLGSGLLGG